MDCQQCENLMSAYLEESLSLPLRRRCAEHLMECLPCHRLFDEVRTAVRLCHWVEPVEPVTDLSERILEATTAGQMMSCTGFDELILDYFEGFITATEFHVFEAHFDTCQRCQRLMTGVRSARELFQEVVPVDVPAGFHERVLDLTSGADGAPRIGLLRRWILRLRSEMDRLSRSLLMPEYVTAVLLFLATIGLLLVDFSDDMTVPGIYRQARHQVAEVLHKLP